MLTKDLLRVSRSGGGYRPQFVDESSRPLAARLLGVFQGHVGEPRGELQDRLTDLEREADDFKLVRGLAALLEREATFETRAAVDPERARRAAFAAADGAGVVVEDDRRAALERAATELGVETPALEDALYADREERQILVAFEPRWDPDELLAQYNLSLAATALFDATEVRARCSDPRRLIGATKRLGLLYEVRRTDDGRIVELTGPDALFRRTRRYGTAFARLLHTLARTNEWRIEATVDDRGTDRELVLSDADPIRPPGADPIVEPTYDSDVERDFAASFGALDLDWTLVREPDFLEAGDRLMVPDFAFDYDHRDFRVFFEVMGFWTPSYVEKKLAQLEAVEGVELIVAADESLGVGEDVEAADHRVLTYRDAVPVKDVRNVLREYESRLVAEQVADLPDELRPDDDVVTLDALASRHGVSEDALDGVAAPDHERVGRTLVRPGVLDRIADGVEGGMSLSDVEETLADYGDLEASAVLSRLGYRVEWDGLSGGTVREAE